VIDGTPLTDLSNEWQRERLPYIEQFRYLAHYEEEPA